MGNHEGAAAAMAVMDRRQEHLHPRTHESEARKVQAVGEVEYMRAAGREAVDWIEANPGTFVRLTVSRMAHCPTVVNLLAWAAYVRPGV
jgi:hypothetical protein